MILHLEVVKDQVHVSDERKLSPISSEKSYCKINLLCKMHTQYTCDLSQWFSTGVRGPAKRFQEIRENF